LIEETAWANSLSAAYARVSTDDQNLELQTEALTKPAVRRSSKIESRAAAPNPLALARRKKPFERATPSSSGRWIGLAEA